jgi:hypothetical protein
MKEKQIPMFPVKEIIHFGAEMMIWEKVTPSSILSYSISPP